MKKLFNWGGFLLLGVFIVFTFATYSKAGQTLVMVGGGEAPEGATRYMIEKGGGVKGAQVLYVRWAEEDNERADASDTDFYRENPEHLEIAVHRRELLAGKGRDKLVAQIAKATVIYFGGGDQDLIMKVFDHDEVYCKTTGGNCVPLATLVKEKYQNGCILGGTSAGTAIMSSIMITSDGDDKPESYRFEKGLGLLPEVWIVDQHFDTKPYREKRMRDALIKFPGHKGLGIYECSAVLFQDGKTLKPIPTSSKALVYDLKVSQTPWFLAPKQEDKK